MNISKTTTEFIRKHPSIQDCIKKNLVNYSSLSRLICTELKTDKFDAVLIACRRFFAKHKSSSIHEKELISLIKDVKIRVRNKMIVAILYKPRDFDAIYQLQKRIKKEKGDFNLILGEETITIITNFKYSHLIEAQFSRLLIKINQKLIQISLIFDEKIESTSGVVAHVYGLLAQNNINILEEMSSWTDVMIILDEADLSKAMNVLSV